MGVASSNFSVTSNALLIAQGLLGLMAILLLVKKHAIGRYKSLTAILILLLIPGAVCGVVMPAVTHLYPSYPRSVFYAYYFYSYWSLTAAQTILMFIFCCGIMVRSLLLLPGLQRDSIRACIWAGSLICVYSAATAAYAHLVSARLLVATISLIQMQLAAVSLCVILFVFVYMRRLGFERHSSLAWFNLGLLFSVLGIYAPLIWSHSPNGYVWCVIVQNLAICIQLGCWIVALALPEAVPQGLRLSSDSFPLVWE